VHATAGYPFTRAVIHRYGPEDELMAHEEFFLVNDREVVVTDELHVCCDGGNAALGHPREYLTLAKGGEVMCGYCGRRYVHAGHGEAALIIESGKRYAA
jgi:uncharacterized Zn-finger protein